MSRRSYICADITANKPGDLCRGGCHHAWIEYAPMAGGAVCTICRAFQRYDRMSTFVDFHDQHVGCSSDAPADQR